MKPELTTKDNPVGLYHDPISNQYMTAQEPVAADALVRVGFKLILEGEEASRMTDKDIQAFNKKDKEA